MNQNNDIDLKSHGLVHNSLFPVAGELARRYNRVLNGVFGLESELDSFNIDKRGLSPEVHAHLREKHPDRTECMDDYLCIGQNGANRFMIILSPDQRHSPLIDPKSSYENDFIDKVYSDARHTIEDITEKEALYGEFDNDLNVITDPHDLLHIRTIKMQLETLDKTIASATELKKLIAGLYEGDNALNQEYISNIQALVKKVGDVRSRPISTDLFPISRELHCFYDRAFNGIYCLRPTRKQERKEANQILFVALQAEACRDIGDRVECFSDLDNKLFDLLHKQNFLKFDRDILERRIQEVEDEVLLQTNVDVSELSKKSDGANIKKRYLNGISRGMPSIWHELRSIKRKSDNGDNFANLAKEASYEARIKLSNPDKKPEVVKHLLAEFDPSDTIRWYETHRQKLVAQFAALPLNRKKYILDKLLTRGDKTT